MLPFVPYTYYIYHVPTKGKYYGVQHGKNANPANLWVSYFTSSRRVRALVKQYGKDSFRVEVRRTFETPHEAFTWEQNVLRRLHVVERSDWLNTALAVGPFYWTGPKPEKTKAKMRKPKSPEHRAKLAEHLARVRFDATGVKRPEWAERLRGNTFAKANKGRKRSKEECANISRGHMGHTFTEEGHKHLSEGQFRRFANSPLRKCIYCGKEGKDPNMKRYHFDNCKQKTTRSVK